MKEKHIIINVSYLLFFTYVEDLVPPLASFPAMTALLFLSPLYVCMPEPKMSLLFKTKWMKKWVTLGYKW